MSSGNDSKVVPVVRTMDFTEFVAYLKENKDAFSDARVPSHSAPVTKRQSLQRNKTMANTPSVLRPKKQKPHLEEKNSTLDSFVIKVQLPRSPTSDTPPSTGKSVSISPGNLTYFSKASSVSLRTSETTSPTMSEESRHQQSLSARKSNSTTEKDEESIEIDLTRSDSTTSTSLSNGNR